jgi:hypothetical protein
MPSTKKWGHSYSSVGNILGEHLKCRSVVMSERDKSNLAFQQRFHRTVANPAMSDHFESSKTTSVPFFPQEENQHDEVYITK